MAIKIAKYVLNGKVPSDVFLRLVKADLCHCAFKKRPTRERALKFFYFESYGMLTFSLLADKDGYHIDLFRGSEKVSLKSYKRPVDCVNNALIFLANCKIKSDAHRNFKPGEPKVRGGRSTV